VKFAENGLNEGPGCLLMKRGYMPVASALENCGPTSSFIVKHVKSIISVERKTGAKKRPPLKAVYEELLDFYYQL